MLFFAAAIAHSHAMDGQWTKKKKKKQREKEMV